MYRSNWSFNIPPPQAYPGHLKTLPSQGGGNLIIRVFQGVGKFELHPRFHVKSLVWQVIMGDAVLEDFCGKDCAFWPVGYAPSNTAQALRHIWKYSNLNIFNIGFRFWICVYNDVQYLYRWFNTMNKKLNRGQLLWPAVRMLIERWSMSVKWSWSSNLSRWDFFI